MRLKPSKVYKINTCNYYLTSLSITISKNFIISSPRHFVLQVAFTLAEQDIVITKRIKVRFKDWVTDKQHASQPKANVHMLLVTYEKGMQSYQDSHVHTNTHTVIQPSRLLKTEVHHAVIQTTLSSKLG